MSTPLSPQQLELIERMGVFHERNGMPPTEARVMALLLVSDETELTFDEIRDLLQVSKSATSNALNTLLITHRIEYITKPGDRKRYFRSNLANWERHAEGALKGLLAINGIMKEILAIRTPNTPKFNQDLDHVIQFTEFVQKELTRIFETWKNRP